MKAMLYADWTNLKQIGRSLLFAVLVIAAAGFLWSGLSFFCMLTMMISIMIPNSLCSADKAYGWDKLSLSLPVLRRDVVGSKFAISGMVNAATLGCALVLTVIDCLFHPEEVPAENMTALLVCEAVALVLMGVDLCVVFKWGVERARYILMACIWTPILAIFLLSKLDVDPFDLSWLNLLSEAQMFGLAAALAVIGLLVYLACYLISTCIYQKTEL